MIEYPLEDCGKAPPHVFGGEAEEVDDHHTSWA
jgi:hypothetical protein